LCHLHALQDKSEEDPRFLLLPRLPQLEKPELHQAVDDRAHPVLLGLLESGLRGRSAQQAPSGVIQQLQRWQCSQYTQCVNLLK